MKLSKTVVAIAALGLGVMAGAAQADALNGAYLGGGLAFDKGTARLRDPGGTFTAGNDKHELGLNFSGGYGATVGGQFHIAGEISYQSTFGKTSSTDVSTKVKDVWAFSILPGYKLGNQTLAYVRLGYAKAKATVDVTGVGSASNKHNGTLYGIGMKHAFSPNLALVVEYQNLDLNGKDLGVVFGNTNVKPGGNGFLLGIQYGF